MKGAGLSQEVRGQHLRASVQPTQAASDAYWSREASQQRLSSGSRTVIAQFEQPPVQAEIPAHPARKRKVPVKAIALAVIVGLLAAIFAVAFMYLRRHETQPVDESGYMEVINAPVNDRVLAIMELDDKGKATYVVTLLRCVDSDFIVVDECKDNVIILPIGP